MTENSIICSICREEDVPQNVMQNVCDCRGTGGYVHFKCLKTWMEFSGRDMCNVCRGKYRGIECIKRSKGLASYMWLNRHFIVFRGFSYALQSYLVYVCLDHSMARTDEIGFNTSSQVLTLFGLLLAMDTSVTLGAHIFIGFRNYNEWKENNFDIQVIRKSQT